MPLDIVRQLRHTCRIINVQPSGEGIGLMRDSLEKQRDEPIQSQMGITLANVSNEAIADPVPVGTPVRLGLVNSHGQACLSRFVWRVTSFTPGNHDRPDVYRLECGNAAVSANRAQFVVDGTAP